MLQALNLEADCVAPGCGDISGSFILDVVAAAGLRFSSACGRVVLCTYLAKPEGRPGGLTGRRIPYIIAAYLAKPSGCHGDRRVGIYEFHAAVGGVTKIRPTDQAVAVQCLATDMTIYRTVVVRES